jgi:MFS family permease
LLPGASVVGEEGNFSPAFEVNTRLFLLGSALLSMVFGLIVASLARTIPGWIDRGMALGGLARSSGWVGIGTGLVLGLVGGGVVTSAFGVPVEGVEGRVVVPVLSALVLGLVGGAALGWLTAAFVQAVSMPASVPESASEVAQVRSRLSAAISVPLAGLLSLVLLVVPFAIVLIRSNHMTSGGAAIIAILAAVSILAIAGLSASSPGMKISRGEFLLALTGIGVVLTIIVAVMLAQSEPHEEEAVEAAEARAFGLTF